jgi:predicted  nucleic acid-binding Zn-ribbon protein
MNADLEKLKSLQEVDREIHRLTEEIAALPKRVAVIEGKLAEAKAQVEKHKAAIKAAELAKRNLEHEIQGEQQKISKYRDQSLEVKTNDQYKALMHEISFAEQKIGGFEDKILQSMVDAEAHERELRTAEAELRAETAEIEKEKTEARKTAEADEKELAVWNEKRGGLRHAISPDVLAHYDRVVSVRKTGIAEAREQKCSACHVMVRPQKYDELRSNQAIVTCDSCSRILYYDPAHEPAPAAPKAKRKKKAEPEPQPPMEEAEIEHAPATTSS